MYQWELFKRILYVSGTAIVYNVKVSSVFIFYKSKDFLIIICKLPVPANINKVVIYYLTGDISWHKPENLLISPKCPPRTINSVLLIAFQYGHLFHFEIENYTVKNPPAHSCKCLKHLFLTWLFQFVICKTLFPCCFDMILPPSVLLGVNFRPICLSGMKVSVYKTC